MGDLYAFIGSITIYLISRVLRCVHVIEVSGEYVIGPHGKVGPLGLCWRLGEVSSGPCV